MTAIGKGVETQMRQRGFNDAYFGHDTAPGESLAKRAGEEALAAYRSGCRAGKRERERERGGK